MTSNLTSWRPSDVLAAVRRHIWRHDASLCDVILVYHEFALMAAGGHQFGSLVDQIFPLSFQDFNFFPQAQLALLAFGVIGGQLLDYFPFYAGDETLLFYLPYLFG